MAWTQADLDALDTAMKGGELTVRYGDGSITYRSLDEMLRLRAVMKQAVVEETTGPAQTVSYASCSKGL